MTYLILKQIDLPVLVTEKNINLIKILLKHQDQVPIHINHFLKVKVKEI